METRTELTYRIDLYLAGDLGVIRQACREYCFRVGLCVTLTPCDFIYTGGVESGVRVGLVVYPRFPCTRGELYIKAIILGHLLMERACQHTFLLVADDKTE